MSWKDIVKSVAPVLGTALGGPFGGMATKAITSAVLGEDQQNLTGTALSDALEATITGDKEALLKLKEADHAFDVEMKQLDVDILKIDADDRASARAMATSTSLKPQIIQAILWDAAFLGLLYAVFFGDIELTGARGDIAKILLGMLGAGLLQINNFFFGSSSGSKAKTDKLANFNGKS